MLTLPPAEGAGCALPTRLEFELFPGRTLTLALFTDVSDVGRARAAVLGGALAAALLHAPLVAGPECVHVAANKALHAAVHVCRLKATSLHAELVHCLHGGRNVGESLRLLGAPGGARDVLVAMLDALPGQLEAVGGLLGGARTRLDEYYPLRADARGICELYRLAPEELLPPGHAPVGGGGGGGGGAPPGGSSNAWAATAGLAPDPTRWRLLADAVIGRIATQDWA